MTGICRNPAGIRPMPYRKTIPGHLPQPRLSIRSLTPWAPSRSRGLAGTDEAAAPSVLSAAAGPGSAPAAPAAGDGTSRSTRWQAIQSMFADDPRSSLELAASLVDDSVESVVMSVKEQQHSLRSAWHGDDPGTEELRTTLRQYRAFWNRLEDFSGQAASTVSIIRAVMFVAVLVASCAVLTIKWRSGKACAGEFLITLRVLPFIGPEKVADHAPSPHVALHHSHYGR
jgi:hypothetical protein